MENKLALIVRLFCVLVITISSSGCSLPIHTKGSPLIETVDKEEIQDANYMARYLMDRSDRLRLQHVVRQTEAQRVKKAGNLSTGVGIAGTSLLGNNPLSRSGVNTASNIGLGLDAAFLVEGMLRSSGNLDLVSKILLPPQYKGVTIKSPEQASRIALEYTKSRIDQFAKDVGRTVECIHGCKRVAGAGSTIYKLTKKGFTGNEPYDHEKTEYLEEEQYNPPALFVSLNTGDMVHATNDPIRNRILGFTTTAWESQDHNGWQIWLFGKPSLSEDGELKLVEYKAFGKVYGKKLHHMYYLQKYTPIARHFYRTITGGDNLVYFGYNFSSHSFFALKGDYYQFFARLPIRFMEHKVDTKTDVTALEWIKNKGQQR
jgi:hypothetical protein